MVLHYVDNQLYFIMYKSLLLVCALMAPVFAQDQPAPPAAPEKGKDAPRVAAERGQRPPRPGMMRGHMALVEKLVMDKYDADKNGKLDDAEKAKIKEDSAKIREERQKARQERAKKAEGEANTENRRAPRGEGRRGGPRGEGQGRPEGAPTVLDRETMMVGHALLVEKYDTDKDGRLSESEREAVRKDAEALPKPEKPVAPQEEKKEETPAAE